MLDGTALVVELVCVVSYGKVAGLVAVVAAAIGTTVQAEGGAVSLDVTEALAVVALLG